MAWTLGGVIREQARRRRDAPMIIYSAQTITWSEMDARASRVAQALLAAGLAEQSRVAFLDKKCPTSVDVPESLPRNPYHPIGGVRAGERQLPAEPPARPEPRRRHHARLFHEHTSPSSRGATIRWRACW